MKYTVVYRNSGVAEMHALGCKEFGWDDFASERVVDAEHGYGAAWAAWDHDEDVEDAIINATVWFPCLQAGYVAGPPRKRTRRPTVRNVPFHPEDLDGEIIAACYGRTVTWRRLSDNEEGAAKLYPEGVFVNKHGYSTWPHRHTTISVSSTGRRSLNFIDRNGFGFRSVDLESIVSVK